MAKKKCKYGRTKAGKCRKVPRSRRGGRGGKMGGAVLAAVVGAAAGAGATLLATRKRA